MREFRLTELEPRWMRLGENGGRRRVYVQSAQEADGILFLCPLCFEKNHGEAGTHSILCWRPRVPLSEVPGPGRWEFQGDSFENLTLASAQDTAQDSVHLTDGFCAHFRIQNGTVRAC